MEVILTYDDSTIWGTTVRMNKKIIHYSTTNLTIDNESVIGQLTETSMKCSRVTVD